MYNFRCIKIQIIYLDFGRQEAEQPDNLEGIQDLCIEIILSEAEKPYDLLGFRRPGD